MESSCTNAAKLYLFVNKEVSLMTNIFIILRMCNISVLISNRINKHIMPLKCFWKSVTISHWIFISVTSVIPGSPRIGNFRNLLPGVLLLLIALSSSLLSVHLDECPALMWQNPFHSQWNCKLTDLVDDSHTVDKILPVRADSGSVLSASIQ